MRKRKITIPQAQAFPSERFFTTIKKELTNINIRNSHYEDNLLF